MRRHRLAIALALLSIIESSLVVRSEWPPENLLKAIELLLLAYLPAVVWLWLESVSISNEFRVVVKVLWILSALLESFALRLLLRNEMVGLLWYAIQFWWGILGIGLLILAGLI